MVIAALDGIDTELIEDEIGSTTYRRGADYARKGRVLRLNWESSDFSLDGRVLGRGGVYETKAYFEEEDDDGWTVFVEGECTCPVAYNCKHVAAIVVAATGGPLTGGGASTRAPAGRPVAGPSWEDSLEELVASAATPSRSGGTPLAVELRLDPGTTGSSTSRWLSATIVRQGGRNGKDWVNGGLSWGSLDSWQMEHGDYVDDHLLVLRQMYALYLARPTNGSRRTYYSGGNIDKAIDFTAFDRSLWTLLEDARRAGLRLVHARRGLGEVTIAGPAEIRLDVTQERAADPSGLVVTPELRVGGIDEGGDVGAHGGVDVVPLGFIGTAGHGVVYARRDDVESEPRPENWQLGVAWLATPAAAPLRQMVRSGRQVKVPASGRAAFADEIWPRLRHVAAVVSSDGSFTPPAISPPRLVLHAAHGPGHALDLTWEWAYDVGPSEHRVSVDTDPSLAGYRDPAAERALLSGLEPQLGGFGVLTEAGLAPRVQLTELDTMRFCTEALPLLVDEPGVAVEVTGTPADYREVTHSLEIGLSTGEIVGETDWFDLGVTLSVEGRELPFADVFVALAAGEAHMLLPGGGWFSLEKPGLQTLRALIDEARAIQDQPGDGLRISLFQADLWDELRRLGVVHHQAEAWERKVGALLSIDSIDTVDVPASVTARLRPYQEDGFRWLAFLWEHGLGGILADDMGLGKTLQALALICHARGQAGANGAAPAPFLIVAPTSVVPNWAAEASRFAPGLAVTAVTDTLKRSGRAIGDLVAGADIVVTSYTLFRLDADAYNAVDWSGLVLDEAQAAKNHRSKVYGCIRKSPAPFKLAITGTPMENNLMELWSLLSITAPGLFPSPDRFAQHYARPIERQGDAKLLARLRRRIKPLVKRRTKELVAADLPPKQEQVLYVELNPRHRKIYQTHLQRERQKVLGLIDDFDRNRLTILRSLTLLRQLSLHPALVDASDGAAAVPCAKLDTLVEHLDELAAGGHRALVFSQFTGFLGLVRDRLDREGIGYCYLDGRTRKRDQVLRRFKEGTDPVFLISLKAGGSGLNLTEADYCFLLDPWWNPATEAQAIDRTHRIGQTRNVIAYRLIARDTIEEKVMTLKERKAQLFTGLMDDGDLFGGTLAADDVRALFASG